MTRSHIEKVVVVLLTLGMKSGNAVSISLGAYHTCALLEGDSVRCWGANCYGELGDGTTTTRHTAIAVPGIVAKEISLGFAHTCALLHDGSVKMLGLF